MFYSYQFHPFLLNNKFYKRIFVLLYCLISKSLPVCAITQVLLMARQLFLRSGELSIAVYPHNTKQMNQSPPLIPVVRKHCSLHHSKIIIYKLSSGSDEQNSMNTSGRCLACPCLKENAISKRSEAIFP